MKYIKTLLIIGITIVNKKHTVCPRSLDPTYIVAYCMTWAKTSGQYSSADWFYTLGPGVMIRSGSVGSNPDPV